MARPGARAHRTSRAVTPPVALSPALAAASSAGPRGRAHHPAELLGARRPRALRLPLLRRTGARPAAPRRGRPRPRRRPRGAAARPARGAADRGTLLHALLEDLNLRRPVVPERDAVRVVARARGLDPAPGDEEADGLIATVAAFVGSDLCARLGRAGAVRREQRFAFPLGAGVLMTGAVDVLAREGPGRVLICDYKSDRLKGTEPERAAERDYALQRQVYALAGLHAGAATVEVAHCYLERPEAPATTTYTAADREGLDAAVGRAGRRGPERLVPGHRGAAPRRVRRLPGPGRAVLVAGGDDAARRRRPPLLTRRVSGSRPLAGQPGLRGAPARSRAPRCRRASGRSRRPPPAPARARPRRADWPGPRPP